MHPRRTARALVAGLLAVGACASTAGAASAKNVEPLNQYKLSGNVDTDALARAGFDLNESRGANGSFRVIATAEQAKALHDKGATVRQLTFDRQAQATPTALPNPTKGYDVFRPWSLKPAPCPTTCSTPLVPLKKWYHDLASRYSDIVKEETIGHTILGQPIKAYKLTNDARDTRDGSKPVVLYESTQHAREWISAEVNRRLFQWYIDHRRDQGIKRLLAQNEIWFIPMMNPDGYDYTFTSNDSNVQDVRLWRKNLRDVNGDGLIDPQHDGVDMNRNWPEKWNYDLEGSSDDPSSQTYHGTGPASEPEVQGERKLQERLRPRFLIDYHSAAKLILYPEGWQVETEAADAPLMKALAGDDDKPAIPGFDPDVSAELYTTNGDVTGDAWGNWGTQAFTVELTPGSGPEVGGTTGAFKPDGGFIFQDDEAAVQAEFAKNLDFALDLAKSAKRPDEPVSHLGNTAPDFVPTTFSISHGDPQTVEVNAKRSLGNVRVYWQINGGRVQRGDLSEFAGGERYGKPGAYYHRLRGQVSGAKPGDKVQVWFAKGGDSSDPFTYTLAKDTGNQVLVLTAEDYTGKVADINDVSPIAQSTPYPGPLYQGDYEAALQKAGIGYDVYDVDANGRTAPSAMGVLSHYKAIVWETGEDFYVREPDEPGQTGNSKLFDDEILNVRDFLNEGGKALIAGKWALEGSWEQLLYNPLQGRPGAPWCKSSTVSPDGNDVPPGQNFNCVAVSNDFQQYWLGAFLPLTAAGSVDEAAALPFKEAGGPYGNLAFTLNGEDSKKNQDNVYDFLETSSILPKSEYPQFASEPAIKFDRAPAFDPPTGTHYAFSQAADASWKRMTQTVDLTGKTSGDLTFKASYDTEPNWDFLVVEAHTVGSDDWTTLPDVNGHTDASIDENLSCPGIPIQDLHPFMKHYVTLAADGNSCTDTGTTGAWHAATGNSGTFENWKVDLSAYAGKQVEISISYISDPGTQGIGVLIDDAKVTADGATVNETSFEDGFGAWTVAGPPADSPGNSNDWISRESLGYVDAPGMATADTLLWGFGLEGVTGADNRATLIKDALTYLGAAG